MNDPLVFHLEAHEYRNPFYGQWVIHLAIFDLSLACKIVKLGSNVYPIIPLGSPRTTCTTVQKRFTPSLSVIQPPYTSIVVVLLCTLVLLMNIHLSIVKLESSQMAIPLRKGQHHCKGHHRGAPATRRSFASTNICYKNNVVILCHPRQKNKCTENNKALRKSLLKLDELLYLEKWLISKVRNSYVSYAAIRLQQFERGDQECSLIYLELLLVHNQYQAFQGRITTWWDWFCTNCHTPTKFLVTNSIFKIPTSPEF
jgi:hypothetical protein